MDVLCLFQFSFLCFISLADVAVASWAPTYLWPLGDSSVHKEVMQGQDGHLPDSNQCFPFSEGYPGLPYRAITLKGQEQSFVDFYLNGGEEFRDLTLSLSVFPAGEPDGTILNFLCETGDIFKLAVLQGLLFVSFWDEFGVSVGVTAVPELLTADTWSHLLVSREFETGRIKVFHDGDEIDNIDDDFPNQISLPSKGHIRLGSSLKDKSDHKFKGRFACFQIYNGVPTDQEVRSSQEYCMPDRWNILPKVNLEARTIDGEQMECVTGYVAPRIDDFKPKSCDVIDMACISSGINWYSMLRKHKWTASRRDTANFHLIGRNYVPVGHDHSVLGDIFTRDKMICSRLCLRVHGCQAFTSMAEASNTSRCILYSHAPPASGYEAGASFFSLT